MGLQSYYAEHLELILLFGLIGYFLSRVARQKGFYKLHGTAFTQPGLSLVHVAICFAIYLINAVVVAPLLVHGFSLTTEVAATWVQVSTMIFSILLLLGFCTVSLPKGFRGIWKDPSHPSSASQDIFIGMLTWLLAFPIVAAVEQCADLFVYAIFHIETYEQVAVTYFKNALKSPPQLIGALLMILGAAPFMEELLFRGLLQNWMKNRFGIKAAILITSLCFALFHISESHGVGNLSLVPSLFVFSCFLGFIYERQKSLLSSIILHTTFNLVTILRIIFTIDTS